MTAGFDLSTTTALFKKRFGDATSIIDMTALAKQGDPAEYISTGSISLDMAIGTGGLKIGTVTEVFGQESSGKSTLVVHLMKQAQIKFPDLPVAYVDAEGAFNKDYAQTIGLDLSADRFLLVQEGEAETALNAVQFFAERGVGMAVLDSVPAMVPEKQLESGDSTDTRMGGNAKFLSDALPKLISICRDTRTTAVFVNQVREKIGVVFGNPETTPGGRALKFYSSLRIETRIADKITGKDGQVSGVHVKAHVLKNKIGGSPYRKALYPLMFGSGIDEIGDLVDLGKERGLIEGTSWLKFGEWKAQGREGFISLVRETPKLKKSLTDTVWGV